MTRRGIDLRKDRPGFDLSKDKSPQNIALDRKPETTKPITGIGVKQEIGNIAGFDIEARGKVDLGGIIPQQGISVERDTTNNSIEIGINAGSTRSKLGVNVAAEIQQNEDGTNTITEISGGVNVAGFGVGGRAGADGEIGGEISALGITVDVERDSKGNISGGVSIRLPGIEIGIGIQPDEGILKPVIAPPSDPTSPNYKPPNLGWKPGEMPALREECEYIFKLMFIVETIEYFDKLPSDFQSDDRWTTIVRTPNVGAIGVTGIGPPTAYEILTSGRGTLIKGTQNSSWVTEDLPRYRRREVFSQAGNICTPAQFRSLLTNHYQRNFGGQPMFITQALYRCGGSVLPFESPKINSLVTLERVQLPNVPQHIKKMNCCDKVDAIYRVLGCAKFEKKGFEVDNAFMSPGATGTSKYKDFYDLKESEYRTWANGMIFNPTPAPGDVPFELANATAWAEQMYLMQAESMGNGNTTQKVEISVIMQLAQMTKLIAELTDKVKFLSECMGYTPQLDTVNIPFCFTIHEKHKGFNPKKPLKEIDTTAIKTDKQVENALAGMLKPSHLPIETWEFKADSISLVQLLRQV